MKKAHIIFDKDHNVVCVLTSEKFAKKYADEFGYTIETYKVG